MGEGEAVGDGEAIRSVVSSIVSGSLEGMGGAAVVGSVRSVVRGGGSYGPLEHFSRWLIGKSVTAVGKPTQGIPTTDRIECLTYGFH